MKDTMTKKEFSAYTEELMGDILFRLKDNGGSMLKDTMDNIIEDIYGRKFKNTKGVDIQRCWGAYLSWTDDTYDEMYRRGWMTRTGNTLHLTDKGRRADNKGARIQRSEDAKADGYEEILNRMAFPKPLWKDSKRILKYLLWVVLVIIILWLFLKGYITIQWIIEKALDTIV